MVKDGELRSFTVAGDDGVFFDAEAEIVGNRVVAWSQKIRQPKAVRYNWANYPMGNLYNVEGFPAAPFRTDDYPLTTVNNK